MNGDIEVQGPLSQSEDTAIAGGPFDFALRNETIPIDGCQPRDPDTLPAV